VEISMLDMKFMADRRQLADLTGIALEVLDEYRPVLAEIGRLDDQDADCDVCSVDGAKLAVQWYGRTRGREEQVYGACCRSCVGRALGLEDVDPYGTVELEYLPLVPKAGA
jgi:hypothetical protein